MGSANHAMDYANPNVPMMNVVLHPATVKEMQYKDIMKNPTLGPQYRKGLGNELGRLCQGIRDIQGTNTCFFVELTNIPKDRKITYGKLVCDNKPNKAEKERAMLTVGSDRLDYTGDMATSTADITTFKILINSTLSTEDAEMMMTDIKNCSLGTPLIRYEYMRLPSSIIPDEIITKYNLQVISVAGWVYLEIRKGIYGMKQAGLLANQLLQQILAPYGYYPAHHTPGLWLHKTRPIAFTLVVDDFEAKYVGKDNAHHLHNALLRSYEITAYWGGAVYSGMSLRWDYQKYTCDISMPGYVTNVLNKFQHSYLVT
jgi:hypothetical protein